MHIYTHTHMHVYRYVCLRVCNAQLVAETQKVSALSDLCSLISLTNFNLPYSDVIREVCGEYELTVIIL